MRRRTDLMLIDSPPLLRVGDAMRLSSLVDGVLLLTQLNLIRRGSLAETRRLLDTMPGRKLGFVMTGSQREDRSSYGDRYGGYGGYKPERTTESRQVQQGSAPH